MNLHSRDISAGRRKMSDGFQNLLEGVEDLLRATGKQASQDSDDTRDRVRRGVDHVRHWAGDVQSNVRRGYSDAADSAQDYVREHPAATTGMAVFAVAGVVLAACLLLRR